MAASLFKYFIITWFTICSFNVTANSYIRQCIIDCAEDYVGVKEETNNNDGDIIENLILSPLGFTAGTPYCAAFTSFIYRECNVPNNPNSAWSPSWAVKKYIIYKRNKKGRIEDAKQGDIVCYYIASKGRVGHVGIFNKLQGNYIYTIEGNTSDMQDKGRDGIFKRVRHQRSAYIITNFIDH